MSLRELLCRLFGCAPRLHLSISVTLNGATFEGPTTMILTTEQKVLLTITALTAAGNPARFDGVPQWNSTDLGIGQFEQVEGDPNSVYFVAREPGSVQVSVVVDADLGAGVSPITGFLDVVVVEPGAAVVQIVAGDPVLQ